MNITISNFQFRHYCCLSAHRTALEQYNTTGRKDHRHELEDSEQALADAEKALDEANLKALRGGA